MNFLFEVIGLINKKLAKAKDTNGKLNLCEILDWTGLTLEITSDARVSWHTHKQHIEKIETRKSEKKCWTAFATFACLFAL